MYYLGLDEIDNFLFDLTHLPGSRNSTDPLSRRSWLSRRGFASGDGQAASTGYPGADS